MMSGPAPVLAATAAFGRTSSQLSLSTRTSMPYLAVNACTFFMYWSMSPWTKRLQRSTRSFAPFSGWLFHWACASLIQIIGNAAAAATPAPAFSKSLRLLLICSSLCKSSAARRIEKIGQLWLEAHRLARAKRVALAHHRRDVGARELAEDLRVGAGGLDDHHLHRHARRIHGEMLGPHAQQHVPAGLEVASRIGQLDPGADRDAAGVHLARDEIHRWRTDEAGDELVRRVVVELQRRADLLDLARVHDDDLVRHGHRLDLVVGDVDRSRLQSLVQRLDLGAHRDAQLGVQVGERLVEQEHLRFSHDRASHRDALALAA